MKEVYNYNNASQLYDLLNDTLTNSFYNYNYNHNLVVQYNYNGKGSGFGIGVRFQDVITKGKSLLQLKEQLLQQRVKSFSPTVNYNHFKKNRRFNINYNFSVRPPQASQLQTVIDNSNPLNIRLGNPDLKYASTHYINYNFSFSKPKNELFINCNGNYSTTINQVVTNNRFDPATGVQTTQPVNMNGNYNAYLNTSLNIALKGRNKKDRYSLNLEVNGNISRNVGMFNDVKNSNVSKYVNVVTGIRMNKADWLIMSAGLVFGTQSNTYSQTASNITNKNYGIKTDVNLIPFKITDIKISYDFRKNSGLAAGFNKDIHMVNAEITQYFSTRRVLWLKLKVFDLLKQNTNITRYAGENYIEDYESSVLTKFFLVSLNYRLSKFGNKAKK